MKQDKLDLARELLRALDELEAIRRVQSENLRAIQERVHVQAEAMQSFLAIERPGSDTPADERASLRAERAELFRGSRESHDFRADHELNRQHAIALVDIDLALMRLYAFEECRAPAEKIAAIMREKRLPGVSDEFDEPPDMSDMARFVEEQRSQLPPNDYPAEKNDQQRGIGFDMASLFFSRMDPWREKREARHNEIIRRDEELLNAALDEARALAELYPRSGS